MQKGIRMNEYELAVNLFDRTVAELDGERNELVERFCADSGIEKTDSLAFVFGGFVMGLDAYAKLVDEIEKPSSDAEQIFDMIEKLPREKMHALKVFLKEMLQ